MSSLATALVTQLLVKAKLTQLALLIKIAFIADARGQLPLLLPP